MRQFYCWFFVCLVVLSGCASNTNVADFDKSLQEGYIPLEEEIWADEQADKFHEEFVRKGLLYTDPGMLQYLESVKQRLLENTQYNEHIHVFLIRSATPNAFALPNGNIYFNTGLFSAVTSEEQLAAIMGHEIIHVINRHGVKGVIDRKNTLVGAHVADLLTGGFGLVYFGAIANIMDYSREQETEADTDGLKLLAGAGYPPEAIVDAFKVFQQQPELKHVKQSIYSSHPSYQNRIASLQGLVSNYQASEQQASPQAPVNVAEFTAIRKKLVEENIRMRLRYRQFNLANALINSVSVSYFSSSKLDFYRGEIRLGFYKYPDLAAKEEHWITTGKDSENSDLQIKYIKEKKQNLQDAIKSYEAAVSGEQFYPPAYKRLGEAWALSGEKELAVTAYQQYLDAVPQARDRRFVEYKLKKLRN